MSDTTLDYRNPRHAALRQRVRSVIGERETLLWMRISAMLAVGVPLSFLAPLALAFAVAALDRRWDIRWEVEWWSIVVIASAIVIPLLYLVEYRSRGRFFLDTSRLAGLGDNVNELGMLRTASRGEWELQTTVATWVAVTEVLLIPPRLVLSALGQWRMRRYLGELDTHRATQVLHALLESEGGIPTRSILRRHETRADLWPTLLLLIFHDLIGVSKSGDRVWLLSDARRAIAGSR